MHIGIVVYEDNNNLRESLCNLITFSKYLLLLGNFARVEEVAVQVKELQPEVILMDIDMPQMNGMIATQKAIEMVPNLKIIALTMFGDEEYYYRMIELGVKGFILKSAGIAELERAINDVLKGKSYFSNELLQRIIQNFSKNSTQKIESNKNLSDREIEVLSYICKGLTTDEIAETLHLSPKTIKSHRANLLEKTACKNTPTLILYALKNKIIKL